MLPAYAVLAVVSNCYPPVQGRLPTRYSPVRHSVTCLFPRRFRGKCFVRLACVRHAASVHPEPGSNSHIKVFLRSGQNPWLCLSFFYCSWAMILSWFVRLSHCFPELLQVSAFWNSSEFSGLSYCLIVNVRCVWRFRIKRRRRDLNPRAAWTTYTLSRGTSSASWVLLLIWIFTNILFLRQTQI